MAALSAVLQELARLGPEDTVIYLDYHEEDISVLDDRVIPPAAEAHFAWERWRGFADTDNEDDPLELWVYVDSDGWEVARVHGSDVTTKRLPMSYGTSPTVVARALANLLTGRSDLSDCEAANTEHPERSVPS